jgi:hypothetical protein
MADLASLLDNAEKQTLLLRDAAKAAQANRCGITRSDCLGTNVHACETSFTAQTTCEAAGSIGSQICNNTCGYNRDYSTSTVRVPQSLISAAQPSKAAIEAVCYSALMEPVLTNVFKTTSGIRSAYFGSVEGTFRFFPSEAQETCGKKLEHCSHYKINIILLCTPHLHDLYEWYFMQVS